MICVKAGRQAAWFLFLNKTKPYLESWHAGLIQTAAEPFIPFLTLVTIM